MMKSTLLPIVCLALAGIASATATILLRAAGSLEGSMWQLSPSNGLRLLALVAYGAGFIAYAAALRDIPAGSGYLIMTATTLLVTLAASWLFLHERLTMQQLVGAAIVLLGVYLVIPKVAHGG